MPELPEVNLKKTEMETRNDYRLVPGFGNSFGAGWNVMMDNFLRLFLVIIILSIIASPFKMLNHNFDFSDLHRAPWNWGNDWGHNVFTFGTFGIFAAFFGLLGNVILVSCKACF